MLAHHPFPSGAHALERALRAQVPGVGLEFNTQTAQALESVTKQQ